MPEGRLIRRKITGSRRLNKLPLECRYLMREFIIWVDREGRLDGEPHWINRTFFCGDTENYTDTQVAEWLQMLHDSKKNGIGLIELYKVDDVQYLWLPGFEGEQSKSWLRFTKEKEAESSIPPPPSTREKRKAIAESIQSIIPTEPEIALQEVIKSIPGWDFDEAEDLIWIRSLSEDFPNVSVDNLKACRDFHSSKPEEKKGPWKNRIRNWLKHELEYSKEGRSGAHRQPTAKELRASVNRPLR